MSKALDELLTKLPQWLGQFTHCLTHPSQVLSEQLATPATPTADDKPAPHPVTDGAAFLILSFAVAAGVSIAFPVASMSSLEAVKADGPLAQSAGVLRDLFVLLGAAALVHGGSRLLGNRQGFAGFFRAVARFSGVTLVLMALVGALTNLGMADPTVARNWQELRQLTEAFAAPMETVLCKIDPKTGQLPPGTDLGAFKPEALLQAQALFQETMSRPMVLIAAGLQTLCLTALCLWLGWVWWRYLRICGLSPARALAASALGAAALGASYLLLSLIDGGQMNSQLMQRCS
ncbi:hypothetical protein LNV23_02590 [Paucibacter sp. DJ1R-11]|uniref:hypothetical protein n=1 Tax=Paucibacter sp. DJ1R-11 TaxID=2893556 RepID=UPI0021E3DB8C|nr:hypothetical protein [Paucibacter sp. DJ1R-11]MCV2362333.1 hypothetical protein [Paucibacter sp. DJ1R-11]